MRSIPTVTRYLLLINVIVYLGLWMLGGGDMIDYANFKFGLHYIEDPMFAVYQIATYMFLHGGIDHLFFNMFALWMFGCVVERAWGTRRYLVYYLVCGIGAGLVQEAAQFFAYNFADSVPGVTVGASGAIYGILLAFGMTWPENKIFIFPFPVPIKAKWFVCLYAGIELFSALGTRGDGVAHVAHLGGMVFGFLLFRHWMNGGQFGMRDFSLNNLRNSKIFRGARETKEYNKDWEYNRQQQDREAMIDRILDKVRRNGYDSLSEEEKRILFEK